MAHPPKRGKRAQKKGAFGPFRPKKVAALIIWHEFLTSGLLSRVREFLTLERRPQVKNTCQMTDWRLLPWVPVPPKDNLGLVYTLGRTPKPRKRGHAYIG
jgi:hypothetical protein